MQSVRRLAAVFLLEATLFMSVCNTWGGAWMQQGHGTIRADVFEKLGGHAEVSSQAWSQGWLALQPLDITYGTDLRESEERDELLRTIIETHPRLVLVEFPCTYWSHLTTLNLRTVAEKQKLRRY